MGRMWSCDYGCDFRHTTLFLSLISDIQTTYQSNCMIQSVNVPHTFHQWTIRLHGDLHSLSMSRYLDRIIRLFELEEFSALLAPHQKATTADGVCVCVCVCVRE